MPITPQLYDWKIKEDNMPITSRLYDKDELPWDARRGRMKYDAIYVDMESNIGQWHVFSFASYYAAECARSAVIHYAGAHQWEVITSVKDDQLAVLRKR
jgi:hypothetical protein